MSDRKNQTSHDFTYIWNLKNKPTKNRNRLIDAEKELVVAGGEGQGREKKVKGLNSGAKPFGIDWASDTMMVY